MTAPGLTVGVQLAPPERGDDTMTQPAALVPQAPTTLPATVDATALLEQAITAGVPVETMERLLAMRERLRDEQAKAAFFDALTQFQAEAVVIKKTKTVTVRSDRGTYSYAYAPLEEIIKAIREPLRRHGLSYRFDSELIGDPRPAQRVTCIITHTYGHSESSLFEAPIDTGAKMNSMQKAASAVTYARRYALCDALGIVTGETDDDARGLDGSPASTATRGAEPPSLRPGGQKGDGGKTGTTTAGADADPRAAPAAGRVITAGEIRSLWAAVRRAKVSEADFRQHLGTLGIESTKELRPAQLPALAEWLAAQTKGEE